MPPTENRGSELILLLALLGAAGLLIVTVVNKSFEYETPYDNRIMASLTRH